MKYGNYLLTEYNEHEVLKLIMQELKERYSEKFLENKELNLSGQIAKYPKSRIKEIHKDYDWEVSINYDDLFNQAWTKEKTIKSYTAKTDWNDEDYFFETENHFIRLNWGTGA